MVSKMLCGGSPATFSLETIAGKISIDQTQQGVSTSLSIHAKYRLIGWSGIQKSDII